MDEFDEGLYDTFATLAAKYGASAAIERLTGLGLDEAELQEVERRYKTGIESVGSGGPVIANARESWYPGAQPRDPSWHQFVASMESAGRGEQVESVHKASDTIVGLTPDPAGEPRRAKGLVVGFVQSGKTTNFTAVSAKVADLDYRMVIVLAGIHNALRNQTQERLEEILISEDKGSRWIPVTRPDQDFDLVKLDEAVRRDGKAFHAASMLSTPSKTLLLVVKKNHTVLRKVRDWLSSKAAQKELERSNVLIIDDEADQASVETKTINPLIREIIGLMPRSTYIGYTATPFANVFINPHVDDDLYPRDFIYPLPRPEGYFGPEKLFGRDIARDVAKDLDDVDGFDGYDMIREIPEEDEFLYRPRNKAEVPSFVPTMTSELRDAIAWFALATAARWCRAEPSDSSMLIHTSFQTDVHLRYQPVIELEVDRLKAGVKCGSPEIIGYLDNLWKKEINRVNPSNWGRESEDFDEVLAKLPGVLADIRVVVENSKSSERLSYRDKNVNTIIAVGGNTLSRGITLNGLVSSVFIRPTNTYDTLLQMGRWFGFREGYEELPRIWTTEHLKRSFRHLAQVESEMRTDMKVYESQGLRPDEAAIRIRTHPSLRITAKMGAAVAARTSYDGARLQVRVYERDSITAIQDNWIAGENLIQQARRRAAIEELSNESFLLRDVPVELVLNFLENYSVVPDQPDVDTAMIRKYIEERVASDIPQMTLWNVAVRAGEGQLVQFSGRTIPSVIRAPLKDSQSSFADIGTLMVPQDLVVDIADVSSKEAREIGEAGMKARRWKTPEVKDKGLLVLYPIDKDSDNKTSPRRAPMQARHHLLGLAIVFPRTTFSEDENASKRVTHMWVDLGPVQSSEVEVELAPNPEVIDSSSELYGE